MRTNGVLILERKYFRIRFKYIKREDKYQKILHQMSVSIGRDIFGCK